MTIHLSLGFLPAIAQQLGVEACGWLPQGLEVVATCWLSLEHQHEASPHPAPSVHIQRKGTSSSSHTSHLFFLYLT